MATIRCQETTFQNIQAVLFDKDGTLANVDSYLTLLAQARARCVREQLSSADDGFEERLLSAFGCGEAGGCHVGRRDSTSSWIAPTGLMAVGSREHNAVAAAAYVAATGIGWSSALSLVNTAFQMADKALPIKVTKTPPLEGMTELLKSLSSADVNLGIVSADLHEEVALFVEAYADGAISWYCGASAQWLPKTHPDFLEFACAQMSIAPSVTLVIGDSAADLALAQQGAAGFVGMLGGWSDAPAIDGANQALSVATITSLRQVEVFE